MAPRANGKGYLKLALVSCPAALFPAASSSERIACENEDPWSNYFRAKQKCPEPHIKPRQTAQALGTSHTQSG